MSLLLSTVSGNVTINDLKGYTFVHPLVDYDLYQRFTIEDIEGSADLQTAVSGGTVTIKDEYGNAVTDVTVTNVMQKSSYDGNSDGKIDAEASQVESVNGQTGLVTVNEPPFSGTTGIAGAGDGVVPDDGIASTGLRVLYDDGTWNIPSSGVTYKGEYNANTNTPDLDTSPVGIILGDMYTVTVAGIFFTTEVEIGDVLIAEINDAAVEDDWTIVQSNLTSGSVKTLYEANPNTNAFTDSEQTTVSNQSGTNTGDETQGTKTNIGTWEGATLGEVDAFIDDEKVITPDVLLKGQANGVPTLDPSGKIPIDQMPDGISGGLTWKGVWDADTNTPALAGGVGTNGDTYRVSVAGSTNLDGITTWAIGDWALFNGATWDRLSNTDTVASVNSKVGTVVIHPDDLDDTATTNKFVTSTDITKLGNLSGTNTGDNIQATESIIGISEIATQSEVHTGLDDLRYITPLKLESEKGIANGLASLDGSGKVPASQINITGAAFLGVWDANTNNPTLVSSTHSGGVGDYYVVNVAGSTTIDGESSWSLGDQIMWDGSMWDKITSSQSVTSVNTKIGVVVLDPDDLNDTGTTNKFVTAADVTNLGNLSGTNTGDQTSIVGITGTLAQFNTALTDATLSTGGGTATGTNTGDQTSIVGITGTLAQFNTAIIDATLSTGGGTATGTNTGDETPFIGTSNTTGFNDGNIPDDGITATGTRILLDDGTWSELTGSVSTFTGTSVVAGANDGIVIDDGVVATGNRLLADTGAWISLGGAKSMILTFAGGSSPYVESVSGTYEVIAKFIYAGSDDIGTINDITINAWVNSGSGDIRIYDATNALQITEEFAITTTNDINLITFDPLINIPTTEAVIEIQAKKNGGGAKVRVAGIEIEY